MTFQDFHFDARLLEGLASMGYQKPTPSRHYRHSYNLC
jgi:superfamily II DNA/RNA helicase